MDQYDYLTREQLISLVRALGADQAPARGAAPAGAEGFPVFGERAMREFEACPSPMRIFDTQTLEYLAVNDAALKLYGYTREEFLRLSIKDTRHPEEHKRMFDTLSEHRGYLRHSLARRQIKKSGEVVVAEVVTQDVIFNGRKARLSLTIDITGRIQIQELLWQRQQEFESLAEHLPDLVARFDREHRFVYVNTAVEKLTGRGRSEFIGRTQHELGMPTDIVETFRRSLAEAIETRHAHLLEFQFPAASGQRRFEAYHVPEPDAAGNIATVLCVARDITERKSVTEELDRQRKLLDAVVENLPVAVFIRDANGRYVRRNRFAKIRFGGGAPAAPGTTVHDYFPRGLAEGFLDSDRRLFESGEAVEIPEQLVTDLKTGTTRVQRVHKVPLYDEKGKPWLIVGVADDITALKQAQDMQNRLAAIVNNSSDAIIGKDLDGVIRTWNPGAERLFGYGADEVIGRPAAILIPPDRHDEDVLIMARIRGGELVDAFETVRCRKDGARVHVSLTISPIRDASGQVIGISKIARDITERKQAELAVLRSAALARLLESLARAANEAVTPEQAMVACLERICRHGSWTLGRVALFEEGEPKGAPTRSIWHVSNRDRFAAFIDYSDRRAPNPRGGFMGRVLRERMPVWIEDFEAEHGYQRREYAVANGLRSALGFPIIARGEIVAIMEVFSEEKRPPDALIMGAVPSIASQLARIIERERAHEANARMAAIVESSRDAILSRGLDGTILTWNPGAERLFGYTATEIVGKKIDVLYPPELVSEMHRRQELLEEGHPVAPYETVRVTKGGRRIHVSTSPAPIRDSSGRICGASTVIHDLSSRIAAEHALRESERRLATDLDAMTRLQRIGSLYVHEREMHAVLDEIVDAAIAITGADMGNIQILDAQSGRLKIVAQRGFGKSWLDFWNSAPEASGTCGRALEQHDRVVVEDVSLSPIFVGTPALQVQLEAGVRAVQSTPLLSRSGGLIGMFSTHWKTPHRPDERALRLLDLLARQTADIIERMDAEMALATSEERFRQLAENVDQVFWIDTVACDNNQYVSPVFEKVWGRSRESLRSDPNSWKESVHPDDLSRLRGAIEGIARGRHLDVEYRIVRPDGTIRWIRDRSYPMKSGDGRDLVCGLAEDITDIKQAEQERITHALHQRDALVREVHHRIKNNLQGVVGLLRHKMRNLPRIAAEMEEAIVQLQAVAAVYGLQSTRADGLVSLADMVEAICASAEGLIGGQVDRVLERRSVRPACVTETEAVPMAVALNELVFNALKHQRAGAGKKRARLVLRETGNAAEVRIANRGSLPKGFDYAGGRATGNGLGLVRTLLVAPGADVKYSARQGRVEVTLKLAPPLLAERSRTLARRLHSEATGTEKAAAAHTGRG